MNCEKRATIYLLLLLVLVFGVMGCSNNNKEEKETKEGKNNQSVKTDPLPSWNDGPLKKSIIAYIKSVSDTASHSFIPVIDRIATFDNDGTLWAERPYVQALFVQYRVRRMVKDNPALANKQPFKAVLEKDAAYFENGGEKAVMGLIAAMHTGMTEDKFELAVHDFFAYATYPRWNVPIKEIIYEPQLELLQYLRSNGFTIFICTGGTVEFVRGISYQLYDIPKYQVIGTTFKYQYNDSTKSVIRETAINQVNDKEGKPVSIQARIGQPPVFACGNEGGEGDIAMLNFCQGSRYPSYQLLVNHDDSTREFYYQERSNASLNAAAKNNWHVISMKNDWKKVFAEVKQ
ncbi:MULTISPECIES: HAD family hydrolase [Niastella]|uniref:Haloacid dehalogenase-like hydrolase n=1 Tax=Niastella soli TaxID=2821487 RepID=A0ABS3YYG2_9BACT|nr:HAD family hydrolase [Niastella soli]MBO9202869.1 haloacid dehalogenase-like hydrolase [Niastella soli]